VVWGDYGLRMCDHHRRVSASQLKIGEDAIKVRLKGMRYRLYTRVCASIGVYSSGNEVCLEALVDENIVLTLLQVRMGKGKGSFDHWASRIAVSKIIFELKGDLHEKVVRDAFRLAGNKMPGQYSVLLLDRLVADYVSLGQYEFVKRGDPPVVGITKLDGITMEELKRPRREITLAAMPIGSTAETLPSTASASMSPEA
jgi:ribosomal protein L16